LRISGGSRARARELSTAGAQALPQGVLRDALMSLASLRRAS
jgi:hypothetical protein